MSEIKAKKRFVSYKAKWNDDIKFTGDKFKDLSDEEKKQRMDVLSEKFNTDQLLKLVATTSVEAHNKVMEAKEIEQVRDTALEIINDKDPQAAEDVSQLSFMDQFTTIKDYEDYGIAFKETQIGFARKAIELGETKYAEPKEEVKFLKKHKINVIDDYENNTLPQELRDLIDSVYKKQALKTMPVKEKIEVK